MCKESNYTESMKMRNLQDYLARGFELEEKICNKLATQIGELQGESTINREKATEIVKDVHGFFYHYIDVESENSLWIPLAEKLLYVLAGGEPKEIQRDEVRQMVRDVYFENAEKAPFRGLDDYLEMIIEVDEVGEMMGDYNYLCIDIMEKMTRDFFDEVHEYSGQLWQRIYRNTLGKDIVTHIQKLEAQRLLQKMIKYHGIRELEKMVDEMEKDESERKRMKEGYRKIARKLKKNSEDNELMLLAESLWEDGG